MARHDRDIARLAIPALGALVAEPLYVLADTAVVGNIGTTELAGLAVASSALLSGYAIFIFLAYGTTAAVSRLLGAGREDDAATQAIQGMWLAAAIGMAVGTIVVVTPGPIVAALGATGDVRTNAEIYLRISALGIPAQLLTFAGTGYLRGLQAGDGIRLDRGGWRIDVVGRLGDRVRLRLPAAGRDPQIQYIWMDPHLTFL